MSKFEFNGNLDDENELLAFLAKYKGFVLRRVAQDLNFQGPGAVAAAGALVSYAAYRQSATQLRQAGKIQAAQRYDALCDSVYTCDIQPAINCW